MPKHGKPVKDVAFSYETACFCQSKVMFFVVDVFTTFQLEATADVQMS